MFRHFTSLFCFVTVFLLGYAANAQEYLADESMKLTVVSTDPKYGYEDTYANSIKVGTVENIVSYLRALRGPQGEKVEFSRIGSCCGYESPTQPGKFEALARWAVTYSGLDKPIMLYLNKNVYENPRCPAGFTFATPATIVMPRLFPADSIRRVKPCSTKLYAVDDPLLKETLSLNVTSPDSLPRFVGGKDQLKAFFAAYPISNPEAKRMGFMVQIAFMVTCKGQAGNVQIISKGKGEMATFANEVLAVVNRMPQNWQPAQLKGKKVDCWQKLSFLVVRGQFEQVSYK